ncbi:hypothetical protein [Nocardiopsis sp. FIRDI 009]|uniref:hypothetical protein n=1 Tax=Nocardiopsis sp. FIRDI 009 TaxID=714197 RepID=UPI001E40C8D8|nr:hypothetical protein [Nocardiopsis sp. FIRDI 009]
MARHRKSDKPPSERPLGLRPVFDPALPSRLSARLRRDPSVLPPEAEASRPWSGARLRLLVGGLAVASLNTLWLVGVSAVPGGEPLLFSSPFLYLPGVLAQSVLVGVTGLGAVRTAPSSLLPAWLRRSRGRTLWTVFCLSVIPTTVAAWTAYGLLPERLFLLVWHLQPAVYAAVPLWVAFGWTRPQRLAVTHTRHYLVPDDFDRPGAELILVVQSTIDAVEEARDRLGASFEATRPLEILRAEEWRIASTLYRYQRLRAEHRDELAATASDRVRTLLVGQEARQEAAFAELSAQVRPIMEYGTTVGEALRAHTEWEQIERAEAREERIAELSARASSDGGDVNALRDEALGAVAAKQARDELIDRALAAGRSLAPEPDERG